MRYEISEIMADIIDDANEAAETHLRAALSQRHEEGPAPLGGCLNCGEPLEAGLRWCNAECRNDWAKRTGERNR